MLILREGTSTAYAWLNSKNIKKVYLPASITTIGENAFNSSLMTEVLGVEHITYLKSACFRSSTNLSGVLNLKELTQVDAYLTIVGTQVNELHCPKLTSIPSANYGVFEGNKSLHIIDLPACVSIGYNAFNGCEQISSLNIPNVEYIGAAAFRNTKGAYKLYAPKLTDLGSYETYGNTFGGSGITELDAPLLTEIKQKKYGDFSQCASLTKVNLPLCTTVGGNTFTECPSLTEVNMPNLTAIPYHCFSRSGHISILHLEKVTSMGQYAFYDTKVDSIYFGYTIPSGQGEIPSGTNIYVPSDTVDAYKTAWASRASYIFPYPEN